MTADLMPRPSGRRVLTDIGLALAQVGVALSSLVVWFASGLTFFGESLHREDYRNMAVGFGVGAALLLVGVVAAVLLRASAWVYVVTAVLFVGCALGCLSSVESMAGQTPDEYPETAWTSVGLVLALPTSYPLFAFVLVALLVLTGRSRPAPR